MKEKTADELFEELGYEKHEDYTTNIGCFYCKKVSHYIYNFYPKIIFHFKMKKITIQNDFLEMQELQAINKKCQELRLDMKRWKEIKGYERAIYNK